MGMTDKTTRKNLENLLDRGFRYSLALTHDEMQAEDLVQEACMRMVKKQMQWEPAYFFTIIRNRFIERYRHKVKFPSIPYDDASLQEIPDEGSLRNAEELVANSESVARALAILTPEEREIIYLFIVEGNTAQEISQIVHRPRNSVLSIIYRTRLKLRRVLEKEQREVSP